MGERPDDEVTTSSSPLNDPDAMPADESTDQDTEQIKAEIEQTRSEMSSTIEAIQDRLSPSRIMDRAKDSVLDATVGRVKDAASRAGESAGDVAEHTREAASAAVDRVRANPLPFALLGVGVALMALRRGSKPKRSAAVHDDVDYAWAEPQWQAETAYGSRSRTQSVWAVVARNPVPVAVTAVSLAWLVKNMRSESSDDWSTATSDAKAFSGSGYTDLDDDGTAGEFERTSTYEIGGRTSRTRAYDGGAYGRSGSFAGSATFGESNYPDSDAALGGSAPGSAGYVGSRDYTGAAGYPGGEDFPATAEGDIARSAWQRSQELAGEATGAVRGVARRGTERVGEVARQASDAAKQASGVVSEAARRSSERAGELASQASGAVREAARRSSERAGEFASQADRAVREAARRSTERVGEIARRGREGVGDMAYRTQTQLDRMLDENPLALGLAALAVGIVVGMAIPGTEAEDEYLGQARDSLVDKARNLAQQTADQITTSVEQVATNVKSQVESGLPSA